jgi:hypothetical protein
MTSNKGFSNIQTYDELEASLRMVQRQIQQSQVSQRVSTFFSGGGGKPVINWTNIALFVLGILKQRLSK